MTHHVKISIECNDYFICLSIIIIYLLFLDKILESGCIAEVSMLVQVIKDVCKIGIYLICKSSIYKYLVRSEYRISDTQTSMPVQSSDLAVKSYFKTVGVRVVKVTLQQMNLQHTSRGTIFVYVH